MDGKPNTSPAKSSHVPLPPRWLRSIIRACVPSEDSFSLAQELDALYERRVAADGRVASNLWYARQSLGFVLRLGPMTAFRSIGPLDSVTGDLRMAARYLKRRPGYAAAFTLTLGIGAGVLGAAYTAANWVLLRPVPGVRNADRLITMRLGGKGAPPFVSFAVSNPDLITLRERLPMLTGLAALSPVDVDIRADNAEPVRAAGEVVTANYFQVLRARLLAGRGFSASDDAGIAGDNVVVISHRLAGQWSPSIPSLMGSAVRVNGVRFEIVGIMESGFRGAELPGRADLWFPLSAVSVLDPSIDRDVATNRGSAMWRRMVGRLNDHATSSATAAAANGVMETVRKEFKAHSYTASIFTFQAFDGVGLDPSVQATVQRTLALVSLACGFLMLLSIANLANLSLSQAADREGATAVRIALGAGRVRLARSQLVESLLLGTCGGIVALGLAALWSRWFEGSVLSEHGGSLQGMRMDGRVAAATIAIALTATVIASFRQLFATRAASLDRLLRIASARASGRARLQMSLVAVQVALSLMLVVGSGLLSRTISNLRYIDLGFAPDRLLTFAIDPHLHGYEGARLGALGSEIERTLAQDRNTVAAGLITPAPLSSGWLTSALYGSNAPDTKPVIGAGYYVTPGFLKTLGATVLAGDRDWRGDSGSVAISRGMLEKLYPGRTADQVIGTMVRTRGKRELRIATVIEDVQLSDITSQPVPVMFQPIQARIPGMTVSVFVRTSGASARAFAGVRRAMQAVAPEVPMFAMQTARDAIDQQFAERKVMALAASTLGVLGIVLAAIGLYGVLSNVVAARLRELGIRLALGATPAQLLLRVLLSGLRPALAGLAAGLIGAMLASRLLKSQLFGLSALDPRVYVGGCTALLVVVLFTCLIPAYRASRLSPATVLRNE